MSVNDYHFVTRWRVQGTTGEVADVLRNPLDLVRWWPAVYLAADEIEPPNDRGLAQRVRLHTKGWLPYTLRWDLTVVESRYPERFAIEASGDFVGRGVWTLEQDGAYVNATYDWRIRAEKPLLQRLAPVMRPVLEANHRWAMSQGEESLKLELLRRRAATPDARRAVPPPPGPITYAAVGLLAGAAVIGGGLAYLILRTRRNRRRENG
ncbi:MAG: polyketide cyclase [Acidobacteria bacterium]|nr:polyketide cyclase [Acidobacteriota bacterium]